MKKVSFKYNGSGTHRRAILHMIGEMENIFKRKVTVADVASWMHVSKPTATKILRGMYDNNEIYMSKSLRTRNSYIWHICLVGDVYGDYAEGRLLQSYNLYMMEMYRAYSDNQ